MKPGTLTPPSNGVSLPKNKTNEKMPFFPLFCKIKLHNLCRFFCEPLSHHIFLYIDDKTKEKNYASLFRDSGRHLHK